MSGCNRTDQELLQEYAERRSEEAFAELVSRHVDFVFSAALRMVRDAHLARDVTQGVFMALAAGAPGLKTRPILDGWLHRAARNIAAQTVRSDIRRRSREQEVAAMNELLSPTACPGAEADPVWEEIAPQLDSALADLREEERDALLLRYFQRKSARQIGQAFGISEEAAQKRVSRAVEHLRELFARRGVAAGSTGLVSVIAANAVHGAPAGLTAAITGAVLSAATATIAGSATALTLTKAIAMTTTLQKAAVAATLLAAVSAGIYEVHQASNLRAQVQSLQQQRSPLMAQVQDLQQERDDATNRLALVTSENARLASNSSELLQLRGEIALLNANRAGGPAAPAAAASRLNPRPEDPGATDLAAAVELGRQLGEAILRGDPQGFGKLLAEAREEQARFKTNSAGLNDQQRGDLARVTFAPLRAAFDVITSQAVQGQPNALNAINEMTRMPEFQGLVIQSLGTLAGKGNNDALEVLLDPARFGFPPSSRSSVVGALVPAADNGDERAINALVAVTQDTDQRALWFMAASGLNKAAEAGNPAAIDALINLTGSTNKSILDAAMYGLKKAAANQNQKAADALASLHVQ